MTILVTGGAGYIGSHTIIELVNDGHKVIVVDNFSNSSSEALTRVEKIVSQKIPFYEVDLCKQEALAHVFEKNKIGAVIHFAGLKAVGESVKEPLKYYQNNITSSISLLSCMEKHSVKQLVFSSSAVVYGQPKTTKYSEKLGIGQNITNPYGKTKYMIEEMLMDLAATNNDWQFTSLRYFNPIGAHESGTIGEDPNGIPNNLMPYISQVAVGKLKQLSVFGSDYPTRDGTCIRDYIHVTDVAKAHVAAVNKPSKPNIYRGINIGSGSGTSVLELVNAFQKACGHEIPYKITDRRSGDLPEYFADPKLAKTELGWQTEKTIEDACIDTWHWQMQNPKGYYNQ